MQAILLYLAVYLFMNLGAFTVAGAGLSRRPAAKNCTTMPAWAAALRCWPLRMAVFMFSLVGLPPFAGFVAKLNLMWRLAENGGWWWILVAVIGVNTVFSLYYYARVVRAMYLQESNGARSGRSLVAWQSPSAAP